MDISLIAIASAVFGASLLQAATGIGYGVIAGPVFLILLNGSEAFQISIVHNLLIAMALAPRLWRQMDRDLLRHFMIASMIGLPIGFWFLTIAGVTTLKLLAAGAIAITLFLATRPLRQQTNQFNRPNRRETTAIGLASGLMGGALAMPGPLAAAWMSRRGWGKATIRSTVLVFFVFAYGVALLLQILFAGISDDTWRLTLTLTPALAAGILVGNVLARLICENRFRQILQFVLAATIAGLFMSL